MSIALPIADISYPFLPTFLNASWGLFVGLSISIAISIVGLAYMVGEFLNSPQLKAWVKSELYEVGISILIVALCVAGIALMDTLMSSLTGGHDAFAKADMFFGTLQARLTQIYLNLMKYEVIMGVFSTFGVSVPFPEPYLISIIVGYTPLASLSLLVEAHTMLVDFIGVAFSLVLGQQMLLDFIKENMLKVFLPMGVLFRAFPFTRRMGSSIIAIAVVAYMVYPLTVMLDQEIMYYARPLNFKTVEEVSTLCGTADALTGSAAQDNLVNRYLSPAQTEQQALFAPPEQKAEPWWHPIQRFGAFFSDIGKKFASILLTFTYFLKMANFFMFTSPHLYTYMMYENLLEDLDVVTQFIGLALVFPVIDIMICVSMYRSLAATLGGEEQLFGLAKIM